MISPIFKAAKKAIAYIPCNSFLWYSVDWVWTQEEMMFSRIGKEIGKHESLEELTPAEKKSVFLYSSARFYYFQPQFDTELKKIANVVGFEIILP